MPAVTVAELAEYVLGRPATSEADYVAANLPMLGGCQGCAASIAAFNAYPSTTGFLQCADCIGDRGYETVAEAKAAVLDEPGTFDVRVRMTIVGARGLKAAQRIVEDALAARLDPAGPIPGVQDGPHEVLDSWEIETPPEPRPRFQLTLDNGRGQGAYGTGPTVGEAAQVAWAQWRYVSGSTPPKRAALTYCPDGALRGGLQGPLARTEYVPVEVAKGLAKATTEEGG